MVVDEEKGKRPRSRAPVSCLNCKKRKVRCDKGRPCSGCVKNNVGHLCVYVDPKWADSLKVVAETVSLENVPNLVQQDALRAELQRKIEAQEREIQCLRARLAHANSGAQNSRLNPAIRVETSAINEHSILRPVLDEKQGKPLALLEIMREISQKHAPMTVLAKLSGRTPDSKPAVVHDDFFTLSGFRVNEKKGNPPSILPPSLYSWLNIVKVDPQLTALWFRITSLQKTYHMYKTSLLKNPPSVPAIVPKTDAFTATPTVIDRQSESSSRAGHKCPVVACEFNLMLEETDSPPLPSHQPSCAVKIENSGSPGKFHGATRGEDALEILGSVQSLWAAIIGSSGNSHVLDYAQLMFLVDQYMDETRDLPKNAYGSSHLLRFFRPEILSLFSQNGTQARLEVGSFSPSMSDAEVLILLRVKALYMAMLAIIVEESLTYVDVTETRNAGASSDVYVRVLGLVHSMLNPVCGLDSLMAAFALLVGVCNRLASLYDSTPFPLLAIDVRESFTGVFGLLLETIYKDNDNVLRIWCDPAKVEFDNPDSRSGSGLLLCGLWADFLRLVNNVTLNLVPILRHGAHIDKLLDRVLVKVPGIAASHTHLAYLEKFGGQIPGSDVASLHASIRTQYLVCRLAVLLRNGINDDIFERSMGLADFLQIVSEMATWRQNECLQELCSVRKFEATLILQYLGLFFSLVVFLQCEENGDSDVVARLVPLLFDAFMDLARFSQQTSVEFAKTPSSKYVWAVVAENLARVSHLVAGLLIRFKPDSANPGTNVLTYMLKLGGLATPITMPLSRKEDVLREADRTVEIFESIMGKALARPRTKIWKFYQTFLRNSHKMNPASYAQVHADALGAGRLLDKCPIMSSSNYEVSATRMELARCPVFHSSDPGKVHEPRVSGCPVAGIGSGFGALIAPRGLKPEPVAETKKCPYGHGTLGSAETRENLRKRKWPLNDIKNNDLSMDEPRRNSQSSLILGRLSKYTPPLCAPIPSPVPPPQPSQIQLQPIASMGPTPLVDNFSQAPFVDMDWDSLPNFNFDMMEDEALMGQLNSGDFNNPLIEGLFQ